MARRSKASSLENLLFITTHRPWWVSLLIFLAARFSFHPLSTSPAPSVANTRQLGEIPQHQSYGATYA